MLQAGSTRVRHTMARGAGLALAAALLLLPGCSSTQAQSAAQTASGRNRDHGRDDGFYRSAGREQVTRLELEVARLRADLLQAEESMVAMESGLRDLHTRADAVSTLAEARISVERASPAARWRPEQVREARAKLDEAERQLQAGHSGSAVFFAWRAQRIAETLNEEAEHVSRNTSTRFVNTRNVNLRAGPSRQYVIVDLLSEATPVFPDREQGEWVLVRTLSGPAGWVHTSLLGPR